MRLFGSLQGRDNQLLDVILHRSGNVNADLALEGKFGYNNSTQKVNFRSSAAVRRLLDDTDVLTATDLGGVSPNNTNPPTQAAVKTYIDALVSNSSTPPIGFDASTATQFPTGANATSRYVVTAAGTVLGVQLTIGDMFIPAVASPSPTIATNWIFVQNNIDYATTTVAGYVTRASNAEVLTGTENTKYVTPADLQSKLNTSAILTANQGLTKTGTNITLGGTVTGNSFIDTQGNGQVRILSGSNSGLGFFLNEASQFITIGNNAGVVMTYSGASNNNNFEIAIAATNANSSVTDNRAITKGIEYAADYSAGFTARSLVDKGYVDNASPLLADVFPLDVQAGQENTWLTVTHNFNLANSGQRVVVQFLEGNIGNNSVEWEVVNANSIRVRSGSIATFSILILGVK